MISLDDYMKAMEQMKAYAEVVLSLQKDGDRGYSILANVRDILLPLVESSNNPCGDMLNCTVSHPECIGCLAKQIVQQVNRNKDLIDLLEKDLELCKHQETRLILQLQKKQEEITELKKNSRAAKYYEMAEENLKFAQENHQLKEELRRLKGVIHEQHQNSPALS